MAVGGLDVRISRPRNERIGLNRLTSTLSEVRLALSEIDRVYVVQRTSRPTWVVESVADAPEALTIRLTAPGRGGRDVGSMLAPAEVLVSGVDSLQRLPEVPLYYTETTVGRVLKIGEPGQGVTEVSLATVNGRTDYVPLSAPVMENAREAVSAAETSLGSVAGILDQMSGRRVNRGVLAVSLFDPLTHRAVAGYMPAEMEPEVHQLWLHRVLARGLVTRNKRGQPVRITKIESFELLPEDDSNRASVGELLGIDPDWLGGQDVDEYVRGVRRA